MYRMPFADEPKFGQTACESILEFILAQVTVGSDLPLGDLMLAPEIIPCCWPFTSTLNESSNWISSHKLLATFSENVTLSPVLISNPDKVTSVSPQDASIS